MDESGVSHSAVSKQDGTISAVDGLRRVEPQSANKGVPSNEWGYPHFFSLKRIGPSLAKRPRNLLTRRMRG